MSERSERTGQHGRVAPRRDTALGAGYHSAQVDVAVRLNANESPVAPPPEFSARLAAAVAAAVDWHRYPDRRATELRRRIAELHGVDPSWIFAANGSNEVLQCLLLAYGGPGRTVATFEPTYALHSHIAGLTATTVATGERGPDLALDLDEVRRVVTGSDPVVTFLCSPNNPTGLVEDEPTLLAVLDLAPGLVVVDEAYGQFARWSALDLVDGDRPLIVTRTFSKTWAMAAARLGYAVAPPWVVDELDRVALPYHLDTVTQLAGTIALDYPDEMERRVASLVEERGRLVAGLAGLDVDVWPSGANFVLFRPRSRDAAEVWQALVERSVLVRDCSSWPRLAGCLRVTVGQPDEDDKFLAALKEVLA